MSKIGDKIYIDNVKYVASNVDVDGTCIGCDAEFNAVLCDKIRTIKFCNRHIIWIKQQPVETQTTTCNQTKGEPEMNADKTTENTTEEPKYTLAEFLEACNDWYGCEDDLYGRYEFFKKYLERKNNPEYQEFLLIEQQYLRLKAIFG